MLVNKFYIIHVVNLPCGNIDIMHDVVSLLTQYLNHFIVKFFFTLSIQLFVFHKVYYYDCISIWHYKFEILSIIMFEILNCFCRIIIV